MALQDFQTYVRERMRVFSDTIDISEGSPFDSQVLQPLLRRIGTDPFTLDAASFILNRLAQEFPDLATADGDAISDGLVKPALLLWDPIIREIQRVKSMLSMRDPSTLTLDEAEALGANLFAERDKGKFSRGIGRIYFAQPQPISVNQTNFFTSRGGLHFFPTTIQSIKLQEMILNREGDLYYFDVNVVAEAAGDSYNLGPSELSSIANIAAAVKVTNKARFSDGLPPEDAATFLGRAQQGLTEKSMVTERGIASRLPNAFPEVSRLAITGYRDPEMQRDVIAGGGLGDIVAYGLDAQATSDGTLLAKSKRFYAATGNFTTNVGPVGPVTGFVVTLIDCFGTDTLKVRDLDVVSVINAQTLEVSERVIGKSFSSKAWMLRKKELKLGNIPGGILFPDTEDGELILPDGEVHIGGCVDTFIRGSNLDEATLQLDVASDGSPLLEGTQGDLSIGGGYLSLGDFVLGTNYETTDKMYQDLEDAKTFQYSLEVLDGVAAGVYRVLNVIQLDSAAPLLILSPTPLAPSGSYRWRLLDELDINLVEPKETRVEGSDGQSTQNVDVFTTAGSTDFAAVGVSPGDTLRILNGPDKGDFEVLQVLSPFFTQIQLDRVLTASTPGISYHVFRSNAEGGVRRPLLRIKSIEILDTSGQPIGSKIPYAKAVETVSRSFANIGRGVKYATNDAKLGMISAEFTGGIDFNPGGTLYVTWDGLGTPYAANFFGFTNVVTRASSINASFSSIYGVDLVTVIYDGLKSYLGFLPVGPNLRIHPLSDPGVLIPLFGTTDLPGIRDIHVDDVPDWEALGSVIDIDTDVVEITGGYQDGFYGDLSVGTTGGPSTLRTSHDFFPELHRGLKIGARSVGTARVYFIEPTSAEIDENSVVTSTSTTGIPLNYIPDPKLNTQKVPALPNGVKPVNGVVSGADFSSADNDFVSKGIRVGDELVIDYQPVVGSVTLTDPVLGLHLRQLILSLDNGPDQTITFVNDVSTPDAVSRDGVVDQINVSVGQTICSVVDVGGGDYRLRFNQDLYLLIRANFIGPTSNPFLGFALAGDVHNRSISAGTYTITYVGPSGVDTLTLSPAAPVPLTDQQFKIRRPGAQRITSTQMAEQVAEAGFYYWDIELVSEGTGDQWNIESGTDMFLENYRSDGYYLTTTDETTSFSPTEELHLHVSRSILETGVDDEPENATQISGQNLLITYEYSALVEQVQNFELSEDERVVCSSPLSRHLVPHFIRVDLTYRGGSKEAEMMPDIEEYLKGLLPDDALESSDLQRILSGRGATSISNPIDLLAIVYNTDRSVKLVRSQDALTTGRLASFIPDKITLKRSAG